MKTKTWAESLLNKILKIMGRKTIYYACINCDTGVHEHWEKFTSNDKHGNEIYGWQRGRNWLEIQLKDSEVMEIGQPVSMIRCAHEDCPDDSLVRIIK